jgi:hypothetical protein
MLVVDNSADRALAPYLVIESLDADRPIAERTAGVPETWHAVPAALTDGRRVLVLDRAEATKKGFMDEIAGLVQELVPSGDDAPAVLVLLGGLFSRYEIEQATAPIGPLGEVRVIEVKGKRLALAAIQRDDPKPPRALQAVVCACPPEIAPDAQFDPHLYELARPIAVALAKSVKTARSLAAVQPARPEGLEGFKPISAAYDEIVQSANDLNKAAVDASAARQELARLLKALGPDVFADVIGELDAADTQAKRTQELLDADLSRVAVAFQRETAREERRDRIISLWVAGLSLAIAVLALAVSLQTP